MQEIIHGGDRYGRGELLDFSANTSMLGLPQEVRQALADSIGGWDAYPDPHARELARAIAQHEGVAEWQVRCGNGAADLIFRVVQALGVRCGTVLAPGFAEYERALSAFGCEIRRHFLREDADFVLTEAILDELDETTGLLILCSPNNPTGQTIDPALLHRILLKCADCGIALLMDECFQGFLDEPDRHTLSGCLNQYPNLIILRAFTKLYGMAGLRLGYLLCGSKLLLNRLDDCAPPWMVSAPAQTAGLCALGCESYRRRVRELTQAGRKQLREGLERLGLRVIGSKANYLFFCAASGSDLKARMLEERILIRTCANFPGLDDRFYRICVRLPEENEQFLAALERVLG